MSLVVVLAPPLVRAILLAVARGIAAGVLHLLATVLTAAAAGAVAVQVSHAGSIVALGGLFRADGLSAWMIGLIALVSLLAAIEAPHTVPSAAVGRFRPLFHLFVFTMLLAVSTDDVGLMWVAIEGTTLASVFLVNLERSRASLEAAYKYLLICSVGVAIAFIGTVLVYFADVHQLGHEAHALRRTTLVRLAPGLPARVVELGFVFLLVGYGTKAGLAPMHTWLPDAHSEAPAPVSALMSGVLLGVGVYALVRFKTVVDLAGGPEFTQRLLLALGLLSIAVAAAFLWAPTNYKRMLAYSSIEHIGVVCLGLGFGGLAGVAGPVPPPATRVCAPRCLPAPPSCSSRSPGSPGHLAWPLRSTTSRGFSVSEHTGRPSSRRADGGRRHGRHGDGRARRPVPTLTRDPGGGCRPDRRARTRGAAAVRHRHARARR